MTIHCLVLGLVLVRRDSQSGSFNKTQPHATQSELQTPPSAITMSQSNKRVEWKEKAHVDLLLAFHVAISPTKEQWDKILDEVGRKGYDLTVGAITYGHSLPIHSIGQARGQVGPCDTSSIHSPLPQRSPTNNNNNQLLLLSSSSLFLSRPRQDDFSYQDDDHLDCRDGS